MNQEEEEYPEIEQKPESADATGQSIADEEDSEEEKKDLF